MCVYSVVTDDAFRRWRVPWKDSAGTSPYVKPAEIYPQLLPPNYLKDLPSKKEVQELIELLKAAKKFDDSTGQAQCENETKKQILRDIAKQLGIEVQIP